MSDPPSRWEQLYSRAFSGSVDYEESLDREDVSGQDGSFDDEEVDAFLEKINAESRKSRAEDGKNARRSKVSKLFKKDKTNCKTRNIVARDGNIDILENVYTMESEPSHLRLKNPLTKSSPHIKNDSKQFSLSMSNGMLRSIVKRQHKHTTHGARISRNASLQRSNRSSVVSANRSLSRKMGYEADNRKSLHRHVPPARQLRERTFRKTKKQQATERGSKRKVRISPPPRRESKLDRLRKRTEAWTKAEMVAIQFRILVVKRNNLSNMRKHCKLRQLRRRVAVEGLNKLRASLCLKNAWSRWKENKILAATSRAKREQEQKDALERAVQAEAKQKQLEERERALALKRDKELEKRFGVFNRVKKAGMLRKIFLCWSRNAAARREESNFMMVRNQRRAQMDALVSTLLNPSLIPLTSNPSPLTTQKKQQHANDRMNITPPGNDKKEVGKKKMKKKKTSGRPSKLINLDSKAVADGGSDSLDTKRRRGRRRVDEQALDDNSRKQHKIQHSKHGSQKQHPNSRKRALGNKKKEASLLAGTQRQQQQIHHHHHQQQQQQQRTTTTTTTTTKVFDDRAVVPTNPPSLSMKKSPSVLITEATILAKMQERAEKRRLRREELKLQYDKRMAEKRRNDESEKHRIEAEKLAKARALRRQRLDKANRAKRRRERALRLKQLAEQKWALAELHHVRANMIFRGWLPWKWLVERSNATLRRADKHHTNKLCKTVISRWKERLESSRQHKNHIANRHRLHTLFSAFRKFALKQSHARSLAWQHYCKSLLHLSMVVWKRAFKHKKDVKDAETSRLEQRADSFYNSHLLHRAIQMWTNVRDQQKLEKEQNQRYTELKLKVNGWLSELQSAKDGKSTENSESRLLLNLDQAIDIGESCDLDSNLMVDPFFPS